MVNCLSEVMVKLGINIDHVATIRQARCEKDPEPILAAQICERAGADSIVAHLREDRRHIHDRDVRQLRKVIKTHFNLEMSIHPEIVKIALSLKPDQATLVPERRQEVTTEGGLDVIRNFSKIQNVLRLLSSKGIEVSLFIDPIKKQILKAKEMGITIIELHTGRYSKAVTKAGIHRELKQLIAMTEYAQSLGLTVNAGHGLNYVNAKAIAQIQGIEELNIGHAVISRAIFVGLENAVKEMIQLIRV